MTNATHAYIAVDTDGICQGAVADGYEETADSVADFIRDGMTIHRVTAGQAREALWQPFTPTA